MRDTVSLLPSAELNAECRNHGARHHDHVVVKHLLKLLQKWYLVALAHLLVSHSKHLNMHLKFILKYFQIRNKQA